MPSLCVAAVTISPSFLFSSLFFFFFNDTATTEIYTLSLHDALPIWDDLVAVDDRDPAVVVVDQPSQLVSDRGADLRGDRKSTRLNSSHRCISYAVFCLKKKKIDKVISAEASVIIRALHHKQN